MLTPLLAAKAYAAAQAQTPGGAGSPDASDAAAKLGGGPNFGQMLDNVLSDTIQQSRQAESQIVSGVQGKTDLINVVTAISSAETSLQTVMAVRDQVISAYQQVMQMQI
jgi:flagellar hook-basal body complex protein FliE